MCVFKFFFRISPWWRECYSHFKAGKAEASLPHCHAARRGTHSAFLQFPPLFILLPGLSLCYQLTFQQGCTIPGLGQWGYSCSGGPFQVAENVMDSIQTHTQFQMNDNGGSDFFQCGQEAAGAGSPLPAARTQERAKCPWTMAGSRTRGPWHLGQGEGCGLITPEAPAKHKAWHTRASLGFPQLCLKVLGCSKWSHNERSALSFLAAIDKEKNSALKSKLLQQLLLLPLTASILMCPRISPPQQPTCPIYILFSCSVISDSLQPHGL